MINYLLVHINNCKIAINLLTLFFTLSLIRNGQIRFFLAFFIFQTTFVGVGNPVTTTYWTPDQGANSLTFFLQEKIILSIVATVTCPFGLLGLQRLKFSKMGEENLDIHCKKRFRNIGQKIFNLSLTNM